MNPIELAKQVMAVVGPYDANTAYSALLIARELVHHRENASNSFEPESVSGEIAPSQCP